MQPYTLSAAHSGVRLCYKNYNLLLMRERQASHSTSSPKHCTLKDQKGPFSSGTGLDLSVCPGLISSQAIRTRHRSNGFRPLWTRGPALRCPHSRTALRRTLKTLRALVEKSCEKRETHALLKFDSIKLRIHQNL